ncbi:ABC transporter permease subunit [Bosea thiooxidans]
MAQAAFDGVGAYATAILTTKFGVSWYAAFGISGLLTFAVGLLLGFPALRVRTHHPAFVTLAFSTLVWLGAAQRAMADRRHLRHLQHQPAGILRHQAVRRARIPSFRRRRHVDPVAGLGG